MPPEPNDKMDELLKAYADRRRKEAGAPFEMHPATRQMLQAEVARRNASPRAKIGKWHFLNPARMFLYSTGLAAAVICAALLIKEQSLNENNLVLQSARAPQSLASTKPDAVSDATVAPPATGNLVTLNNSTPPEGQEKFADAGEALTAKKLALNRGSIAMQTDKDLSMAEAARPAGAASATLNQNNFAAAPAAAPMQPAPMERAAPVPADQLLTAEALPQTQQAPGSSPASPALDAVKVSPVAADATKVDYGLLGLFEIRLTGDQIRLIDADGSIYIGKINLPKSQQQHAVISKGQMFSTHAAITQQAYAQATQQSRFRQQAQAQAPSGVLAGVSNSNSIAGNMDSQKSAQMAPQEQGYTFRASGDCHSLGRFVIVEGTYYTGLPQDQLQDLAQAKPQAGQDAESAATGGAASTGARIQGQVRIGNNMRIDINAISVPLKAKSN